ncbi:MAG: phenylalanine--tRNA ligase subunit beta, partial [Candidatus Aenigmarchaeota archaeon]
SALADRGGEIETVDVVLPDRKIETPDMKPKKITVDVDRVKKLSGLDLKVNMIKKLLLKSRYGVEIKGKKLLVSYPSYRQDIMHQVDVIEDIIISYGYNRIGPVTSKIASVGKLTDINEFSRKVSEIMIGVGGQEVLSYILTSRDNLVKKMSLGGMKAIEVENPVSKNWCVFRTWIIPSLIEFIGKNTNREYPQNVFEIGEIVVFDDKAETKTRNPVRLAWAFADSEANFTKAKQSLDFLMRNLNLDYKISGTEHPSFISGRVGRVSVKGKKVAYIGEIHPKVLDNFGIEQPVACFELNLSDLFGVLKK